MGENQERRQARRQKRGALRVEEILQAAGALFAEVGYDKVTTNMIAARAGVSPGSLYQFFSNKEAIAQAFAADTIEQLHQVYDSMLSSEAMTLPLQTFLDTFIDRSEQRHLPLLVSYRLFLALLPLALQGDEEQQKAIVHEMKVVLYRYLEPIVSEQRA